jgi:HPt (histidine-containing phosphotransfer) domain-containing protein
MDGYVSKPIQINELITAIEAAIPSPISTVAKPGKEVFNKAEILARLNGDEDLLAEAASLFLQNCSQYLDRIRRAIAEDNPKSLEFAAHALKGSVANFGAEDAVRAAHQLESMGRQEDLQHSQDALQSLEAEIENVRNSLEVITRGVY